MMRSEIVILGDSRFCPLAPCDIADAILHPDPDSPQVPLWLGLARCDAMRCVAQLSFSYDDIVKRKGVF